MTEFKKRRLSHKFTMAELAVKVGASMSSIQMWECGATTPNSENQKKLEKILGGDLFERLD